MHLHGNVNKDIILGINSDDSDKVETMNTAFLAFKKYYQRACYGTDVEYIKWIRDVKQRKEKLSLLIMGHSLDATDKDVICELFDNASEITVLYHNKEAKDSYLKNLVTIFGKDGVDVLRKEKALDFLSLDSDFREFRSKREMDAWAKLAKSTESNKYFDRGEPITII